MGEETDGVIESVSKLQSKIKALAGVDILTDAGEYKDTYTILKEIGQVWEDMADIDQAALLELMAGKNRANTLSAILSNMEDLEGAYQSALGAEGSALKENASYLDSIQGRIDLFKNSLQTMWMNFIDSDIIKFIVDLGSAALKLVDTLGLLPTVVGGFTTFKTATKEIKAAFEEINKEIQNKTTTKDGANPVVESINEEIQARKNNSDAIQEEKIQTDELTTSKTIGTAEGWKDVAATNAQTVATKALAVAKGLLKGVLKGAVAMLAAKAISTVFNAIYKAIDNAIHRAEKLKEEVEELEKTYKEAKKTFDDNLTSLTTSSDTKTYATLADEFAVLTKGVDQYGNNISLTSDQYERYKAICEKIVGVNDTLMRGYNSATEAIGNNIGVLSTLIDLEKERARIQAEEYVSPENLSKFGENAYNDYINAYENGGDIPTIPSVMPTLEKWSVGDWAEWAKNDPIPWDKFGAEEWLERQRKTLLAEYENWYSDFLKENNISENTPIAQLPEGLRAEATSRLQKYLEQYQLLSSQVDGFIDNLDTEELDGMRTAMSAVLSSIKGYSDASVSVRKFMADWVNQSSEFAITPDFDSDKDPEKWKKQIQQFYATIMKSVDDPSTWQTLSFEGDTKFSAEQLLDKIYNFDPSSVSWEKYQEQMQELVSAFWKSVGVDNPTAEQQNFFGAIDIDFKTKNDDINKKVNTLSERLGEDADEIQKRIDKMPANQVEAFLKIDWNTVAPNSWQDVMNEINKQLPSDVIPVKLYSNLSDTIEKFNEVQKQTAEIVMDNTEVTQEYKDSLIDLGISEEDLADCFDENNKLVVKNASKLKQLVNATKNNISSQTALARAQARLKYRDLYKQLTSLTNGRLKDAQANKAQINLLYQEMSAVQKTIAKYSLLEQQLAEVTKTYSEFEEAQSTDSEYDYMSKTESMLVAAIQAYETGELGTETAQVSIKALVPDFVLENEDTVEEKAAAAHDYLMNTLNKYFVLDFDENTGEIQSAEMKMGNLRKFVEEGFENNVFAGADWQHFEWSDEFLSGLEDAPDKLQYFADKMKVTKEVALAVIQEINNHDIEWLNGDYGSLFDQIVPETLDSKLQTTTARMAELNVQLANGKITQEEYEAAMGGLNMQLSNGAITQDQYNAKLEELNNQLANGKITQEEYTRQVSGLNGQLAEQQTSAVDACNSFIDLNDKMDESQKKLEEYQKQLQSETDPEKIKEINKQYTQELQNYESYIKQKKELENKYGPMTEYTVSIALEKQGIDVDNIDSELTETKNQINDSIEKLNSSLDGIEFSINDDGKIEYKIIDGTESSQVTNLKELGALNEDGTVNVSLLYGGLTDEQKAEVDKLSSLQEKENLINYYLSMNGVDTVQGSIDKLVTTLDNIYKLLETSPIFSANVEPETKTTLDNLLDKVRSWVGEHVANFVSNKTEKVTTEYVAPTSTSNSRQNMMYANGTAHAQGSWGARENETALVGELGTELLVRDGRWTTIGTNGAEFTNIKKGDIIFNHKQTEELLKNGYVTSRGKAYANGTSDGSNSLLDRMKRIINSNKLNQLAEYAEEMCKQYEELTNGNVDLRKRPHLSPSYEHELAMSGGYNSFIGADGEIYASTSAETMTIGEGENQYTIDITPVLENGEVLTSDSLAEYVDNLVTDGSMQDLLDSDKYNLIIHAVPGEYNEQDWSGFEDQLSKYKDGYLDTILDMFDLGGEKAVEKYGFSSVGLADVSRDLQNNGSYIGKEVATAIDDTSEGMRKLDNLINQYVTDVLNAGDTEVISNLEGEIESTASELVMAGENINDVQAKLDLLNATNISDKTFTVTTVYQTIGSGDELSVHTPGASGRFLVYADGTAHATGDWGLPSNEHNALVGELGPEMVVNPHTGRYYTVGDNGAEMVDLPKGAIIFNHEQTKNLLSHGYVTSRGKMLANGTAHAEGNAHVTFYPNETTDSQWTGTGYSSWDDTTYDAADALQGAADSLSDAADDLSDAADDFEEVFDWIEVRLEEIDETLDLLDSQLENATNYRSKNSIIDNMIGVNEKKISNLTAGIQEYSEYAAKLLAEVPAQYRDAAQNGMIAIEKFAGEADEATLNAIENYREWAQKVADLRKQLEETKTTIRDLAIEKFNNAYDYGDVRATVENSQTEKLQNRVDYDEERGLITSDAYYLAMMENSNKKIEYLTNARKAMQEELDEAVRAGQIVRGSNEWYELIDQLYQVQSEIDEATIELEQFQNAINDLYWDNFDELINRLDYMSDETQNLIDLMGEADMVTKPEGRTYEGGTVKFWTADDVQWTEEGIATLGLYAQQMEIAEYTAKQYAEAIDDLTRDYQDGKYSESEYLEKLNELKDGQYDAIQSYYDAQNAIKELNQTRIDSIKDGISKEIEAYEELINKKKEELNAEKD